MIAQAFDTVAEDYDATFTHSMLGLWLRVAVWEHLAMAFGPGDHVLELGCGTGEDAIWLSQWGVHVHATDGAPGMLRVAEQKAERRGVREHITFDLLDVSNPTPPHPHTSTPNYDGAFSNFGALNVVADRRSIARFLARHIRPRGTVIVVIMGPLCPWEWGWYLVRGQVRTAFRRFRPGVTAYLGEGATVRVWYPSPRCLRREFAAYFRHLETVGLGVLFPPSFASDLVERWPRLFERLAQWERRLGRTVPGTWLNDHYLMAFERTSREVVHA